MARTLVNKEVALGWIKEVAGDFACKTANELKSSLKYYFAGFGELDDDFSYETKRIANKMTVNQWKKVLDSITNEELERVLPVVEEVERVLPVVEEVIKTEEEIEVEKACVLLQGYIDDQTNDDITVSECKTWGDFYNECEKYFDNPDYFIGEYIRPNLWVRDFSEEIEYEKEKIF